MYFFIALFCVILNGVLCKETELTIFIGAGSTSCFYESAKVGDIMETQYQVINAGQGDYDIGLIVYDPNGAVVLVDFKKSSDVHRTEVKIAGDYKICFDNTASHLSMKNVFFTIAVENDDDDDSDSEQQFHLKDLVPEENHDIKVEEIKSSVKGVHDRLTRAIHFQDQLKAFMARDRHIVEHNFERVNLFSTISIVVMLFVGIVQIIMVRSLFDEKNRLHKIFKMIS